MNQTKNRNNQHRSLFWEARSRILGLYLVLISGFLLLSIPLLNYLILSQVNHRVSKDLNEELQAFTNFQQKYYPNLDTFNRAQITQLFRDFLRYKIPEDDTFLITIIDRQFYQSNPRAKPEIFAMGSPLMNTWIEQEERNQGEWNSPELEFSEVGRVLYLVEPIVVQGEVKGAFVAAHITAGEIQEARGVLQTSIAILLIFLFLAAFAAWVASATVLNPLQKLSQAVATIDESDLKQRIFVKASGEIGQLTNSFNQMMDRLEKVFVSQRKLLNDVSHELRTPITIIRGHLELMGKDPQEQEETLAIVFDELDRMSSLVDNLLLLAKAERVDFLHQENINLAQFSEEIYKKVTTLANRNWQLDIQSQGYFSGDRQQLTQAIINLVQNAIHHTQTTDSIILGAKVNIDTVSFWIQDTGQGFAPEEQEFIFQRFARAKNSRNLYEGQGLGLSIVEAIVKAHRGHVAAKGELGKGATFTINLPLN